MQLEYNENRWTGLSAFRKACLRRDFEQMRAIAAHEHGWYENENPNSTSFER